MTETVSRRHLWAGLITLAFALGPKPVQAQPELAAALKGLSIKGYTPAKASGNTATWTGPGGTRLTLTLTRSLSPAQIDGKVKQTNQKLSGEQLLFLCENGGTHQAWTNYRSDHGTTFLTYHYWRREGDLLLTQTLVYSQKPKSIDEARQGFVTMRRTSQALFQKLTGK